MEEKVINCLQCASVIHGDSDTCDVCQWTYNSCVSGDHFLRSKPSCLSCLKEYDATEFYCLGCGQAIGKYTEYLPYESIRFQYSFFRNTWHKVWRDESRIFGSKLLYLVIILILEPLYLIFVPIEFFRKLIFAKGS